MKKVLTLINLFFILIVVDGFLPLMMLLGVCSVQGTGAVILFIVALMINVLAILMVTTKSGKAALGMFVAEAICLFIPWLVFGFIVYKEYQELPMESRELILTESTETGEAVEKWKVIKVGPFNFNVRISSKSTGDDQGNAPQQLQETSPENTEESKMY